MTRKPLSADMIVIGAGSAGLSVAAGAAQLGLKVILFEKGEMGGDCLNAGCVPSKALLSAARAAKAARGAPAMGVTGAPAQVDFAAVSDHVRRVIAGIAPHDSQERFEGLGVRVVREAARFTDRRTVAGDTLTATARTFVIATGSRAVIPNIPGLADANPLTNETIFDLTEAPKRLLIIGGGPIGCELGQAFRRLGSEVALIDAGVILPREERSAAALVEAELRADGVELFPGTPVLRVRPGPEVDIVIGGQVHTLKGSHLLVAAGRRPVLEGLNLEAAGVAFGPDGITTDRFLRSSNRRIYAAGDVAGRGQFTHLAGAHASLIVRRSLFAMPVNADALIVPRVTYTDPEIASIGLTSEQARDLYGTRIRILSAPMSGNDRAQAEGDVRGFGQIIVGPGGRVLGACLVGRGAGEQILFWSLVMSAGTPLSKVASSIAPYPTRSEINKRLAGLNFTDSLFSPRTRALVSVLKRLS